MVAGVRRAMGDRLFARVAGPEGPRRRERIHSADGPRWFEAGSPIQQVHGDASMFVGGIRALLMQSLHPLAMAGVMDHSGFEGDPWGRLQRTSYFLAVTTFGTADDAEKMVARDPARSTRRWWAPRRTGARTPRPTRTCCAGSTSRRSTASCAAHQRYGARPLDPEGRDTYVAADRPGRGGARRRRPAADARRSSRAARRLPARAARHARGPSHGPLRAHRPPLPLRGAGAVPRPRRVGGRR